MGSDTINANQYLNLYNLWSANLGLITPMTRVNDFNTYATTWNANTGGVQATYGDFVNYVDKVYISGYKQNFTQLVRESNYNSASGELAKGAPLIYALKAGGLANGDIANLCTFAKWLTQHYSSLNGTAMGEVTQTLPTFVANT